MKPGVLRIVGGAWRRSVLPVAAVEGLRPTPNRIRETLFNWLGQDCSGWHVLDLFAGTGALGFEAASRGAARVRFVEQHRETLQQLRDSQARLLACSSALHDTPPLLETTPGDVPQVLAQMAATHRATYDLIALDPPFGTPLLANTLPKLASLLKQGGFVYIEWGSNLFEDEAWLVKRLGVAQIQSPRHLKAGKVHAHLLRLVTM